MLESIGHGDIKSQNSIVGTRIIEEKQRSMGIVITGTIKLDIKDEVWRGTVLLHQNPRDLKVSQLFY